MDKFVVEKAFNYVKENNGVTFNESKLNPSQGYMVSFQGFEHTLNINEFTLESLIEHVEKCETILGSGDNVFIGVWFNPIDKLYYLDLSENIQDKELAIRSGMLRDQKAIFSSENKMVIGLPERQKSGTEYQKRTYLNMKVRELL